MKLRVSVLQQCMGALLAAAGMLCAHPAQAGTLWYNGDWDTRDAVVNQTRATQGLVYDNFIVPSATTFNITSVFSNDFLQDSSATTAGAGGRLNATTAKWEIRSGVSSGNGGTLIASGDAAFTKTLVGPSTTNVSFGSLFTYSEFTVTVSIPTLSLGAGQYWLLVAPDATNSAGTFDSAIATTSGANAIGTPPGNDDNSFFTSSTLGKNFTPTSDPSVEGPGTWDFSMGINGNSVAVPEPSSLTLVAAQGLTLSGIALLRRRKK